MRLLTLQLQNQWSRWTAAAWRLPASTAILLILFCCALHAQTYAPIPALSFVKRMGGADPLPQTVTVTSIGANFDFNAAATTNNGGNWLTVPVVGFNCCATPRAITAVVTTPAAMAAGTYTGQITLTSFPTGAAKLTIPVTLTVEPAGGTFFDDLPGALSFTLKTGGGAVTSQLLQIRNGGTGALHWTLAKSTADGGNWLTVSQTSATAPSLITVGVSVANLPGGGLTAGHFIGQIALSQPSGGSVTIPVSVVVDANMFAQVNGINFTKVFGGADPLPQTLMIPSMGTNFDFDTNSYSANGGNWLTASAVGFNCCATPRAVTAVVTTTASMPVGTYTGEIVFTVEGNGSMAMTVPVTLTVEPANGTFFNNLPGALSFALKTGGNAITSQTIQVRNGGAGFLDWSLIKSTADGGNWLTVSQTSGTAPSTVTVGVSVANLPGGGLTAGHFIGQLVFSQPAGGTVTVPVSVVVDPNAFSQVNGINFTKVFGGADPLPQTLTIPSTGTNFDFDITSYTANGGNWLSVTPVGFNCCATPRALAAVVTTVASLPVGTYTGEIVFTAEGNGSMAITVPVTLTVEPVNGTFFDNLPGALSFALKTGGTTITSQTIQVRNGGAGSLDWTLATTTSDGGNWLTVSQTTGTAPSQITVGVSVANLPGGGVVAGHFIGQLVLSQSSGGSVTIPVSVVVDANAFVQVNGINFTKVFGGADPLPQTITIASTGTNFDFDTNSYTATGGNWLSVTALGFNCCATPRAITATVTADPSLPVGTYTAQVVFTAEGNGSMAITVPVTLTVEPANGTFLDDVQGQMSFSFTPGSGNPPLQDVQIRRRGSGTLDWTIAASTADGGNWLTVSAPSGTAPSTVHVGVVANSLPGQGLVAGTFIGNVVISSAASTTTIPVSVTVGTNVFTELPTITFTKTFGAANPATQDVTVASTGAPFDFDNNWYTATGGNWLSVTVAGFNCCATPRAITAKIIASPTLPVGTYTGQIVTTAEGNGFSAMTIPVILNVVSSTPGITSVTPSSGAQGQTLSNVAISGVNTHFLQGTTVANFGANITVNGLTVTSATTATANITVQNNASLGARTVTLTTGAEMAALSSGFTVTAGTATLASATPNTGAQGQTLNVTIAGQNTNFVQGTTVANFGAGITVNSLTVNSAVSATANITVQSNATLGSRTVTLTTAAEVATLPSGFGVTTSINVGPGMGLGFYAITPCRAVDTRASQNKMGAFGPPSLIASGTRDFPLLSSGCALPATAQAYSLNITVVPPGIVDFLSLWPTGQPYPGVSTLNSTDGSTLANAAIVPAGTNGAVTVLSGKATDLIIDTNGYFAPPNGNELAFYPVTPCRVADTRASQPFHGAFGPPSLASGGIRDFPIQSSACNIPGTAAAYSLNMTAVPQAALPYLSTWPTGEPYPNVSTLNSNDGSIIANAAIVPAGTPNGSIEVLPGGNTDLIIDVNGYFAPPGGLGALHFYAVAPCRVADTRASQPFTGPLGPPSLAANGTRDFPIVGACGIPLTAQAFSLNMTVVPQGPLPYLSVWPTGQPYPNVSTLNSPKGTTLANAAIVPAGTNGSITVLAGSVTDLIIDINGYFAP